MDYIGTIIGLIKGDTRSLDYSSKARKRVQSSLETARKVAELAVHARTSS